MKKNIKIFISIGFLVFLECLFSPKSWSATVEITSCHEVSLTYYDSNEDPQEISDICGQTNYPLYSDDRLVLKTSQSHISFQCEYKENGITSKKSYRFLNEKIKEIRISKYCSTVGSRKGD